MVSKTLLKLNDQFIELLEKSPENGMGYHIVDVRLKSGKVLTERIVLNCSLLKIYPEENLTENDIESIIPK